MKKVVFLQNIGNNYGGVTQVNKLLGESLVNKNYNVSIISIRNDENKSLVKYNDKINVSVINDKDKWGTYTGTEIINNLKKLHIFTSFKMLLSRIKYKFILKKDTFILKNKLRNINPNYIIVSHYEILDMIPKKMLNKVINVQHSSFEMAVNHRATKKTLLKYKNKVNYVWLTQNAMNMAIQYGIKNSSYVYNAIRFKSDEISDTVKNKTLVAISRLSEEKSIDKMVQIVDEIFKDKRFSEWKLEIYGDGPEKDKINKLINNRKQIKLMGRTDNSKQVLLNSSINLNTSKYEGFSLTILEACECGVPTVTFNFGESTKEEIKNNITGIINDDDVSYINSLKDLMLDEKKLQKLSKNAKDFSKDFQIENIIKKWIKIFNKIDNKDD